MQDDILNNNKIVLSLSRIFVILYDNREVRGLFKKNVKACLMETTAPQVPEGSVQDYGDKG